MLASWKKSCDQSRQRIKKQRHYFADKGPTSQRYGFSIGHVCMWKLDYKESWALKNWCVWTLVLEKTLESPMDCKEIKPVNSKGNQPWIFIGRTDASWSSNTSATWCEGSTHWKRPWCWERWRAGGKGGDRGWDGWMASLIQWTRVWANSRRETWGAAVHGVAKRWTRLGDCTNNVKFPFIVYDSGFSSSRLKLAFCLSCVLKKKKNFVCFSIHSTFTFEN